jgi:hypothetical protein
MYIVNVEPLSGVKPRMPFRGLKDLQGDLGTAAFALANTARLRTIIPSRILIGSVKELL